MRGAGRFLLGAILGAALGYALSLILAPSQRTHRGAGAHPAQAEAASRLRQPAA
jgi:gas vesicle protein